MRRRGVGPNVAEGPETGPFGGDASEGVQQVAGLAGQTVETRHHQHVVGVELVERTAELAAVGLGSARHLPEHLARAGGPELAHLGVNALAVRRDAGIPVNHGFVMHLVYATEKPLDFSAPLLERNS